MHLWVMNCLSLDYLQQLVSKHYFLEKILHFDLCLNIRLVLSESFKFAVTFSSCSFSSTDTSLLLSMLFSKLYLIVHGVKIIWGREIVMNFDLNRSGHNPLLCYRFLFFIISDFKIDLSSKRHVVPWEAGIPIDSWYLQLFPLALHASHRKWLY